MDDIHTQAKSGIKALMVRQVFLQILTFGGGVILARVLGPAQFGLFAIVSFWVGILALVGDFGLAPSFIQRREELTERDLQVGFTIQQILTTIIVLALFLGAPWLSMLYPKAPHGMVWLVRALAFSLYLTSWRSMSALQLERRLQYKRLAWIEVVESVSYQGLAVVLVLLGYGIWSLIWAVLARGLIGTILVYLAAPWRIRLCFDTTIAKSTLRYGVSFQAQQIVLHAADWISPVLVASRIGPQAVGYLTWASSNGQKPLILVDNAMRVAFSHFSRIQHNRQDVERTLTRYLTCLLLPAGLWLAVLFVSGPALVAWIYSNKWTVAVPLLDVFAVALCLDVVVWVTRTSLNSLGLVDQATRAIMARTFVHVVFGTLLVLRIGYIGVAFSYVASLAVIIPILFRALGPGTLRRVLAPLVWIIIPATVSMLAGKAAGQVSAPVAMQAIFTTAAVSLTYLLTAWIASPPWLSKAVMVWCGRRLPRTFAAAMRAAR